MVLQPVKKNKQTNMNYNKLTQEEKNVIINKGTEAPNTGKYNKHKEKGTYNCKKCDAALYRSVDKFESSCGWPSFDDEIDGAIKRLLDKDGRRTEILCANCDAHLGHVFKNENYTNKNIRHCVNSISLNFLPIEIKKNETAIFASGCFWGTEFWLQKQKGVLNTKVGYIGGAKEKPTYEEVCSKITGHAEAVKVVFNPELISFEELCVVFFNTHDPSQVDGQGPDIGNQYRSEIFYFSKKQKKIAEELIQKMEIKGIKAATKLTKASKFWSAEEYHQDYYQNKGTKPYCHFYKNKF